TRSYGASGDASWPASSVTVSLAASLRSAATPMLRSSLSVVLTSCRRGTLLSVIGSAVSSEAHSCGSAAFFAPEIVTSPSSRRPPRIKSLSMRNLGFHAQHSLRTRWRRPASRSEHCGGLSVVVSGGRGGCPLGRGQRLHRQGVDLLAHSIAQGLVNPLVARHAARAL